MGEHGEKAHEHTEPKKRGDLALEELKTDVYLEQEKQKLKEQGFKDEVIARFKAKTAGHLLFENEEGELFTVSGYGQGEVFFQIEITSPKGTKMEGVGFIFLETTLTQIYRDIRTQKEKLKLTGDTYAVLKERGFGDSVRLESGDLVYERPRTAHITNRINLNRRQGDRFNITLYLFNADGNIGGFDTNNFLLDSVTPAEVDREIDRVIKKAENEGYKFAAKPEPSTAKLPKP